MFMSGDVQDRGGDAQDAKYGLLFYRYVGIIIWYMS